MNCQSQWVSERQADISIVLMHSDRSEALGWTGSAHSDTKQASPIALIDRQGLLIDERIYPSEVEGGHLCLCLQAGVVFGVWTWNKGHSVGFRFSDESRGGELCFLSRSEPRTWSSAETLGHTRCLKSCGLSTALGCIFRRTYISVLDSWISVTSPTPHLHQP